MKHIPVLPQRFDTRTGYVKEDAQRALQVDGAIILTNIDTGSSWSEIASMIPTTVWDEKDLLLQQHRADSVHEEHEALNIQGEALPPHSDGYMWGDCFPDIVILVCEEPADRSGGANYLIDGYAVLERLTEDTKNVLCKELVDQTERVENSFTHGDECIAPVIRFLEPKGWREEGNEHQQYLCWKRMVTKDASETKARATSLGLSIPYISLWAPPKGVSDETTKAINDALLEIDQAINAEDDVAPRFLLKKGEALIVDNFRMLHAREAFHGCENKRRMWRVWSWTNTAFALPPEIKPSGEGVPSSILRSEISMVTQET